MSEYTSPRKIAPFLWVDCEFTGLDEDTDLLLEIAVATTDPDFTIVEHRVFNPSHAADTIRAKIDQNLWWSDRQGLADTIIRDIQERGVPMQKISQDLAKFVLERFMPPVVIAGNSLGKDRAFIQRDLPELDVLLHYRSLDVSSLKELAKFTCGVEYGKSERHRALDDVEESIAELRFLRAAMCASRL